MNMTEKLKFVLERVENVGKGENAAYQQFPLYQNVFKRILLQGR